MLTCEKRGKKYKGDSSNIYRVWCFYTLKEQGRAAMCTVCDLKSCLGRLRVLSRCKTWWFMDLCYTAQLPTVQSFLCSTCLYPAAIGCMKIWEVETATNLTLKPSKVKRDTEVITSQAVLFILIKNTEKDKFPRCHRRVVQDLGPVCTEMQSHAHEELHQSTALCRTLKQ